MNLKIEDIEKHDIIVRKKYPTAKMQKVGRNSLIWLSEYGMVASLKVIMNNVVFKFEPKRILR